MSNETKSEIVKALVAIQGEVGVIGKTRKNPQQGYQFRGIDDVVAHVQELQAKHGVICAPRVVEREREVLPTKSGGSMVSVRLLVDHHFIALDGSEVVATTLGEAMDSGDKASNKAMSAALKYALTETYMIPTYEADRDTEEQSPEIGAMPQSGKAASVPAARPAAKPAQRTSSGVVFPNYGQAKGQPVSGASKKDLAFYKAGAERTLNDPSKAKFHEKERILLDAIERELAMGAPQQGDNEPPPPTDDDGPPF